MIPRRVFLRNGSFALVSIGFAPEFLARAVAAVERPRQKTLVAIFQRGAVDGLNMVVPFGERSYYAARPTIAIARPGAADGAIDLDGFFGLHPRLAPLAPLYRNGTLAIVHACGSPDPTRSHFDAQDYMESGTPGVKSTRDGWMNRCLHARAHSQASPFRAVALAPQLPRSLQGPESALALTRLDGFGIQAGRASRHLASSFEAEYAAAADAALGRAARDGFDAASRLKWLDPARYRPASGAAYPRSPYGEALKQIAQLVKADVGLEIAFAESTGWDHHVNEGGATGQIANRLDDFGRGIAALVADLGERMADVVILTMSEFGRAVAQNGGGGTDHGHGTAMLIAGGDVRGGRVYGRWPGIDRAERHEGRDLAVTSDFRAVFGEVALRHLGVQETDTVFPGFDLDRQRTLGFLG